MQGKTNHIRIKRKTFFFVLFILILTIATPALADYLGPSRTVTETTSVCKVVLYECKYVASKDLWKYKKVDDWSCSNEGKPWQAYDNYDGECGPFSDGRTQWGKVETLQTVTTTHPEAMIASVLQGCNLNNGWCNTASELSLSGTEPLSGYSILAVEGSLNGQTFACSGDNCSIPLNEGSNDFSFWAISSWGDSSSMGTFSAKVDTVLPTLGLDITATRGTNGWYVSPTSLTATGSDSTSGLSSVLLSVDSSAWIPSTTLNEGVYTINVQAEDNAGNIAQSSTAISVDTTTPTIDVSVNGTLGNNGWYSSGMQVSANASDATSGVASLESSLDGGVYQAYISPVSFGDGYHTVQFKATDNAGNETETSMQEFYVDTIAPAVDLPAEWEVNDTITYKVQDDGSGLSALRIVIEDEDEKFAKVAWNEVVSGNKFKGEIIWNGKFKDGTIAPPGEYLVWVKTTDVAGNERIALGRVIVPQPFPLLSLIQPSKSSTEIPTPPADLFDPESVLPTTIPNTTFGGSTTPTNSTSVQSLSLSSRTTSASTTTSTSNVIWGAVAASMLGAATAYALDEQKKRKETEARLQAESATRKQASPRANRNEEPPMTRQEKELAKQRKELQKIWDANGAAIYEANREYKAKHGKEMDAASRSRAIKNATMNGVFQAGAYASNLEAEKTRQDAQNEHMANKMTRFEKEEEARWLAQQKAADEKMKAEELQAGYVAYYAAMRQEQQEAKSNWWEQTKSFVQEKIVQPAQNTWNAVTTFVNEKLVQPVNTYVYQPIVKPAMEMTTEMATEGASWVNQNMYQPIIKPKVDQAISTAKAKVDQVVEATKATASKLNETVYQPYIKPKVDQAVEAAKATATQLNANIYQPIIKPKVDQLIESAKVKMNQAIEAAKTTESWVNDKIYQPFLQPVVSVVNENFYQPVVQPLLDKTKDVVANASSWVNEHIYQPVFEPVVNDINKYIYQPLANKAEKAWDKYGEWVHGTLDAAGLIPGFGEIADGLNGLIYLGEGRYLEAGISAMAMIPILGDLGKAGKWTIKIGSEVVEVVAETALKTGLKEIAENASQEALEKVVKETLGDRLDKELKDALGKVATNAAESALERSAKETTQTALATVVKEAGDQVSPDVVKEVAEKSINEFATSPKAVQVAQDAAEKAVKVEINYPEGLAKYKEFVPEMTEISQKAKTAIPYGKPEQSFDNIRQLYREVTDAPQELQEEFAKLQMMYSEFTDVPLKWDEFMNLKQLYSQAENAKPALQNLIEQLAKQTNGTHQFRTELKDVKRVLEKMAVEYSGVASHLTDLTAGRIVYEDLESLYRALGDIHTNDQLIFFKDRFLMPQKSGYQDILMNVELPNGHIGELRLEVGPMNKAAEIEHQLYEIRRSLREPLSVDDALLAVELEQQGRRLYEEAWRQVIANFANQ